MWLLTSEPHSAWLVVSHDQAQRQSSGSTNLMVPEHAVPSILLYFLRPLPIDSDPRHIINQTSVSYLFISQQICCISGNSPWLTSASIHLPPPQKKPGKIFNYPLQPATKQLHICNICIMWQIFSAIRPPSPSVWLPCVISILSNSPKIVSFFYPALCSFLG